MPRFHIEFGNSRRYRHAFYDTECAYCTTLIPEGTPIGFLEPTLQDPTLDYMCIDCLDEHETKARITRDP